MTNGTFWARAALLHTRPVKQFTFLLKRGQAVRAAPTRLTGSPKKALQINPPTRLATVTGRMAVSTLRMHTRLPLPCLYDHRPRQQELSDFLPSQSRAQYHWLQIPKLLSNSRVWTRMLEMTISCLMYDWSVNLYISLTLMRIPRKEKYELLEAED